MKTVGDTVYCIDTEFTNARRNCWHGDRGYTNLRQIMDVCGWFVVCGVTPSEVQFEIVVKYLDII